MLRIVNARRRFLATLKFSRFNRKTSSFSGSNANYLDDLYELWKKDKNNVHPSWDAVFKAVDSGVDLNDYLNPLNANLFVGSKAAAAHTNPLNTNPIVSNNPNVNDKTINFNTLNNNEVRNYTETNPNISLDHAHNVNRLIESYRMYGHYLAKIDPFNNKFNKFSININKLSLNYWNLDKIDINTKFKLTNTLIGDELSLDELVNRLNRIYSGSIGLEIAHCLNSEHAQFLIDKLETRMSEHISTEHAYKILNNLIKSTIFENYLAKKFPSEKRFGLEGCETLILLLREIIDTCAVNRVKNVIIGIAHRGRLNVLANVCEQPPAFIFQRFNDELEMDGACSSDVKYHLGLSRDTLNPITNENIRITLIANPSHLEAVNPVVTGRVKAEQYLSGDHDYSRVLPIVIHGDAAFAGQGIVYETLNMAKCDGYNVGGTIHIVTNNQIGFTTNPECSRSTYYCTEVGKIAHAPIIHVNADDCEAVRWAAIVAAEFRHKFKHDIVVDIVGYRRNGHNEGDNPGFTQPHMYELINSLPTSLSIYSEYLINNNIISRDKINELMTKYENYLNTEFEHAQTTTKIDNRVWIDSPWKNFFNKNNINYKYISSGYDISKLKKYLEFSTHVPNNFKPHPMIKRILNQRLELLSNNKLDWSMAEIATISSLVTSGTHVRISGQDVERGTFSHRHHVLSDQNDIDSRYCALNNLEPDQQIYSIVNSPLSEYSVLGYEHGYSMASPFILSIWEAQFGDFANNAQVTIDQFISSGEDKWIRQSGLVMLLPHGYDGMGPEHSSARLERYLQLCREDVDSYLEHAQCITQSNSVSSSSPTSLVNNCSTRPSSLNNNSNNICNNKLNVSLFNNPDISFEVKQLYNCNYIVANPTTPANLFHILRRQLVYNFRKPLIIMSPKNLLRHNLCRSDLSEFGEGTHFVRYIPDSECAQNPAAVKRLVICSGKIYYELLQMRSELKLEGNVALSRVEQISPFPIDLVSKEVEKYENADVMYVQEEPKNQGAYYFVKPMIEACTRGRKLLYSGREVSASPATGSKYRHNIEQKKLLMDAFKF